MPAGKQSPWKFVGMTWRSSTSTTNTFFHNTSSHFHSLQMHPLSLSLFPLFLHSLPNHSLLYLPFSLISCPHTMIKPACMVELGYIEASSVVAHTHLEKASHHCWPHQHPQQLCIKTMFAYVTIRTAWVMWVWVCTACTLWTKVMGYILLSQWSLQVRMCGHYLWSLCVGYYHANESECRFQKPNKVFT